MESGSYSQRTISTGCTRIWEWSRKAQSYKIIRARIGRLREHPSQDDTRPQAQNGYVLENDF